MKKYTKILCLALSVVLVFACGVGATLAYMKAETKAVTNTFAANGLIDDGNFILTEYKVERTGENNTYTQLTETTNANSYELVPGLDLPKEAFVKVTPNDAAYLFVEVKGLENLPAGVTATMDTASWTKMEGVNGPNEGQMYKYTAKLAENVEVTKTLLTGNKVTVDAKEFKPTNETKMNDIVFYAYLTQATNFATPEAAWTTVGAEFGPAVG